MTEVRAYDAIVVGAGFGGLYTLHKLRNAGLETLLLEAADDVGGAWYWNRYPGARCDVESLVYSYSFSPELDDGWRWTEKYSGQPEIQAYLRFVAERLDLLRDIRLQSRVTHAAFDDGSGEWTVQTRGGDAYRARFVVMATGPITEPVFPDIPGFADFAGETYHTARWPRVDPDLRGKRVGVIGTGSSGTQVIPIVAQQAQRLYVFIRTPGFTVPARNMLLGEAEYARWRQHRAEIRAAMWRGEIGGSGDVLMDPELRRTRSMAAAQYTAEQRREVMERRWQIGGASLQGSFRDVMTDAGVNAEVADFVRGKIRSLVTDPVRAEMLVPTGYALGTKRLCVGTDFYETLQPGRRRDRRREARRDHVDERTRCSGRRAGDRAGRPDLRDRL